jgi:hypothetical protein
MEQSLSWEANRFSASQEIPHILWHPKVHHERYRCPKLPKIIITFARVLGSFSQRRNREIALSEKRGCVVDRVVPGEAVSHPRRPQSFLLHLLTARTPIIHVCLFGVLSFIFFVSTKYLIHCVSYQNHGYRIGLSFCWTFKASVKTVWPPKISVYTT